MVSRHVPPVSNRVGAARLTPADRIMTTRPHGAPGITWLVTAGALAVLGTPPIAIWVLAVVAWALAAERRDAD
jgi:hypothetical protein